MVNDHRHVGLFLNKASIFTKIKFFLAILNIFFSKIFIFFLKFKLIYKILNKSPKNSKKNVKDQRHVRFILKNASTLTKINFFLDILNIFFSKIFIFFLKFKLI